MTWMILGWIHRRPSALGAATGAVAGLAAVTPAAGFIAANSSDTDRYRSLANCYYCIIFRTKRGVDESLDVWAVHGMGGIWGVLATGIFASVAVNSAGADGLIYGNVMQLGQTGRWRSSSGRFCLLCHLDFGQDS